MTNGQISEIVRKTVRIKCLIDTIREINRAEMNKAPTHRRVQKCARNLIRVQRLYRKLVQMQDDMETAIRQHPANEGRELDFLDTYGNIPHDEPIAKAFGVVLRYWQIAMYTRGEAVKEFHDYIGTFLSTEEYIREFIMPLA